MFRKRLELLARYASVRGRGPPVNINNECRYFITTNVRAASLNMLPRHSGYFPNISRASAPGGGITQTPAHRMTMASHIFSIADELKRLKRFQNLHCNVKHYTIPCMATPAAHQLLYRPTSATLQCRCSCALHPCRACANLQKASKPMQMHICRCKRHLACVCTCWS